VIDDANVRRGKPSINAMFSSKHAVMLGDIFYSKAFYELSKFDSTIAQIISQAVTKLSLGELLDVELSNSFNEDEDKYMNMIYLKTASLIEATARSAAIVGKKDEKTFALFGKNLGLAFQIVDDILDITSDSKTLGKPALLDLKEGKTTLPYIYAYKEMNKKDKEYLKSLFKKELDNNEKAWIKEKLQKTNAINKAKQKAKELAQEVDFVTKKDEKLFYIMRSMIERIY